MSVKTIILSLIPFGVIVNINRSNDELFSTVANHLKIYSKIPNFRKLFMDKFYYVEANAITNGDTAGWPCRAPEIYKLYLQNPAAWVKTWGFSVVPDSLFIYILFGTILLGLVCFAAQLIHVPKQRTIKFQIFNRVSLLSLFLIFLVSINLTSLYSLAIEAEVLTSYWEIASRIILYVRGGPDYLLAKHHAGLIPNKEILGIFWLINFLIFYFLCASISMEKHLIRYKLPIIYPVFALSALFGAIGVLLAKDWLFLYLAIELMTISFYFLIAVNQTIPSMESAIKYFIIGTLSGFLLLYSIFYFYFCFGTINFVTLHLLLNTQSDLLIEFSFIDSLFKKGLLFFLISISIKMGAAPFHYWLADVYEGAPSPSTLFLIVIAKLPLIYFLIRISYFMFINYLPFIQFFLVIVGTISVLIGSISAFSQRNVKRLLIFSSIADTGFLFLGLSNGGLLGVEGSLLYLFLYLFFSLIFWQIILLFEEQLTHKYALSLGDFTLSSTRFGFIVVLLIGSLAGVPPLVGFWSKWAVLLSGVYSKFFLILLCFVFASMVSTGYYLQFIKIFYFEQAKNKLLLLENNTYSFIQINVLVVFTLALIFFSVDPEFLFLISRDISLMLLTNTKNIFISYRLC